MENPCPPSLPSSTAAAAITTSRSSITAAIHTPSTAAAATITTTRSNSNSNSNSGSNTDRDAGSNSGSSAAIQSSLRQLNKNSYKISKHSGDTGNPGHHRPQPPPLPPPLPPPPSQQPPPPQPQPPVYNIHKNDFRDVVQKLTGSPAHHSRPSAPATAAGPKHAPGGGGTERGSPPPVGADLVGSERAVVVPLDLRMVDDRMLNRCYRASRGSAPATAGPKHAPSPSAVGGGTAGGTSSRLQKIRPPPLAQLTPRPPPSLGPSNPFPQTSGDAGVSAAWARPSPLSPLPPLPTVSAAAESPITAYMRCLRSGAVPHQQGLIPSPRGGFSGGPLLPLAPSSPLGFGCVPSPRSACQGVLPPGLMLPPSPTPSPRWGGQ